MAVLRVHKMVNPFVLIHEDLVFDNRISLKAKGLMMIMASLPDDHNYYKHELMEYFTDGEYAFDTGLQELEDFGYIRREGGKGEVIILIERGE